MAPKILVRLNEGAPQTGGLQAAPGDVVQLRIDTPGDVGKNLRFEIYGYPEGWSLPSGWIEDALAHVLVSSSVTPTDLTLPDTVEVDAGQWGKWFFRLFVDGKLVDDSSAVELVSPNLGLHALPAGEGGQYGGSARQWGYHLEDNLRKIDASGGGGGGGSITAQQGPSGTPLTSVTWLRFNGATVVSGGAGIAVVTVPTSLPPNGAAGGDLGSTYPNPSVLKLRGVPLATGLTDATADAGMILVSTPAGQIGLSDAPPGAGMVPLWQGTALTYASYSRNNGVATVDLTGRGSNISLTAEETDAGLVVLEGTLAANTTLSVPSVPGRSWLYRRSTSGLYTLQIQGGDTGVAHMLPGQERRLSVDGYDKLCGEGLRVLEFEVLINLAGVVGGDTLFALCKLPSRALVERCEIYGVVTPDGDAEHTGSVGDSSGGSPGYAQILADGPTPGAGGLRGHLAAHLGSDMVDGGSYSDTERTLTYRHNSFNGTGVPTTGVIRVHVVARWFGV